VVLRLDRDLSFSSVRRVLRLLADAGASRVMLQLEQSDDDTFLPGT
jgi:biopolymer transport protein ExbD